MPQLVQQVTRYVRLLSAEVAVLQIYLVESVAAIPQRLPQHSALILPDTSLVV
jgi:hypothetical protein